ncbi:HLA class II histocompatibility antigen gamma chain isoform 1-T1 [Liasis olivaceus]
MEDDHHILLPQPGSAGQQARASCSRGTAYTVFSLLGVLLLAGQAVTVYFVYQHDNQISKLTKSTQQLKLDSLTSSISKNVKSSPKMAIANVMPLALNEPEFLKMESQLTNSTEDQVKRMLLRENPTRTFPELKSNFLENMGQLKIRMTYNDWKDFETWMHKWLIFQMAQKQNSEEKVKTKCQEEECGKGVHPGRFCAKCDEKGDYLPRQCRASSGYCWCVYKNGTMIEGSKIRGRPDCAGILDPENVTYSGDQN